MRIPFSPPDISDAEISQVVEVLKSGWITTGPKTAELEKKLSEFLGTERVCCFNSATAALEMALRYLGIGPGDEVITCAYSYTASASVIAHVGAKIVFVDCQPNSFEMDYEALEKSINKNTKAIIPIDLGGVPCNYRKIFEIVDSKKNLFKPINDIQKKIGRVAVISDSAHALGASYEGKMIGRVADFTAFSFHAVKNFTTGEGGALTWNADALNSDDVYHKLSLFSRHGQNKDALKKIELNEWEYDIEGPWYKCNMTDIMAGIGLAQLERYPDLLAKRKALIERYDSKFKSLGIEVLDHYTDSYSSSGHLYITRVPGIKDLQRREIIRKMAENGIATNVHFKPLPMMTAYKNLGFDIKNFPNAFAYYQNEITLPLYSKLDFEQVDFIADTYIKILKDYL